MGASYYRPPTRRPPRSWPLGPVWQARLSLTPRRRRGTCLWSASGPDLVEWGSNPPEDPAHDVCPRARLPRVRSRCAAEPGPRLRALLRPPRGRLRLRRDPRGPDARPHRGGPSQHLALPRSPAARRRAAGRAPRGDDAAGARAEPRRGLGAPRALPQERRRLSPDLVLQGPRGLGGGEQGARARARHGGVRLDRQPRQLGRRPRRRGGPAAPSCSSRSASRPARCSGRSSTARSSSRSRAPTTTSTASAPSSPTATPGRS